MTQGGGALRPRGGWRTAGWALGPLQASGEPRKPTGWGGREGEDWAGWESELMFG